jgi:hypothetical protein
VDCSRARKEPVTTTVRSMGFSSTRAVRTDLGPAASGFLAAGPPLPQEEVAMAKSPTARAKQPEFHREAKTRGIALELKLRFKILHFMIQRLLTGECRGLKITDKTQVV